MRKHLPTMGKKRALLTGRGLLQNQAQGVAAICCNLLGGEGERREKKEGIERSQKHSGEKHKQGLTNGVINVK